MAWYAYCIAEQEAFHGEVRARRPFLIETLTGISNAPIYGYPSGEFAVIVSEYDRPRDLDQKAIIEHHRVVSTCFTRTTVIPFKFGTVFENDESLRKAVRGNRKVFLGTLEKLKGKSEMHLKLIVKDGSLRQAMTDIVLPESVGSDYLCKLREKASRHRERQTKARAISVQVQKMFLPLDAEVSCKRNEAGGMAIDIAHLIDSESIQKYQTRYSLATKQFKDVEIAISGPWPPYHFLPGKVRTVAN
jgi:gas vesicle protein GvpL/GvpF